jgi:hypothetical protein
MIPTRVTPIALAIAAAAASAAAQPETARAVAPAPPAPYSVPWLLRSTAPTSVVRIDQTVAFADSAPASASATTAVTSLLATYKASPRWVPIVRQAWIRQSVSEGSTALGGKAFSNPLAGVTYVRPLGGPWRLAVLAASTVPLGSGGGDSPDPEAAAAIAAAVPARSAMDNALFAVNYWTLVTGADVSRVTPGLTLQAEATVFQLTRVRGPQSQDPRRTNLTLGLHAGRFVHRRVSVAAEARMQRWMTEAAPVRADAAAREQFTFALGTRLHLKAGDRWLRPGLSYTRALDAPMSRRHYGIVQLDLPIVF